MAKHDNSRLEQMKREAWIGVGLVVVISIITYANQMLAYGKSAAEISYVFGFPRWFFIHIFVIYPIFFTILWYIARNHMTEVDLEATSSLVEKTRNNPKHSSTTVKPKSRQEVDN